MSLNNLKDKSAPHNLEAEKASVGALLLNFSTEILDNVLEFVKPSDFYQNANRLVFQAIIDLSSNGSAVDLVTLVDYLTSKGELDKAGGPAYIASLTSSVPTAANVSYYAKIVAENSVRRNLISVAHNIISNAHDETEDSKLIVEEAEKAIFEINDKQQTNKFKDAKEVVQATVEAIEKRYQTKDTYTGVPSGFNRLDDMTSGFQKQEMVIIGARPSVGKTAFALTLAANTAIKQKISTGFFTLEMSAESLMQRIIAAEARIESQRIRSGFLKNSDFHLLTDAAGRIYDSPLYIDDTPNITLLELRAQARRMKAKHDINIIFIDYIGLITSENKQIPRHEQMSEVSRSLKALARELDIPVVVLSQVGRQSEGKAPGLADLRESGAIEQDADMVMFLHRDRGIDSDDGPPDSIETELIIAKQRNGPVGVVKMAFIPHYTRFEPLAYDNN
ncbi:replicative DNA helicase [Thiospirochaeta perfilievii]|uniref:Replicative DNA helicase n=1 Tax=Thiospirochaeta perfilievii TaxID=252967 RepID=A0A5C1QFC3_9SPIO|nr:replicative DNA helicase [Thiospirochaeta perfilievii]QEN06117.1 replicative DNA helicase [Thiospirochaeta perfilievii]